MLGKLRNMTAIYLFKGDKVLLLFRQDGSFSDKLYAGVTNEDGVEFIELPEF